MKAFRIGSLKKWRVRATFFPWSCLAIVSTTELRYITYTPKSCSRWRAKPFNGDIAPLAQNVAIRTGCLSNLGSQSIPKHFRFISLSHSLFWATWNWYFSDLKSYETEVPDVGRICLVPHREVHQNQVYEMARIDVVIGENILSRNRDVCPN